MERKLKPIATVVAVMVILVVIFQLLWPRIYPWIVSRNPYPTQEYYQIIGLVSPNGLSAVTIVIGLIIIAWILLTSR